MNEEEFKKEISLDNIIDKGEIQSNSLIVLKASKSALASHEFSEALKRMVSDLQKKTNADSSVTFWVIAEDLSVSFYDTEEMLEFGWVNKENLKKYTKTQLLSFQKKIEEAIKNKD